MTRRTLFTICTALALCSCEKQAQSVEQTTNNEFYLHLLFEHDGIKVYRFYDNGNAVYFTDARGATQWRTKHHEHSVETIE